MLHLKCTGQDMKVAIDERIADKYINANKVHFEFCERWAGMTITAQFTQKQKDEETQEEEFKTYNVLVDPVSSTVIMPNEIEAGDVYISAFGVHPNTGVRITSVPIKKTVDKSGFVDNGETPIPPTPDLYAQLIKSFAPTGANKQYVSDADGKAKWENLNIKAGNAHGSLVSAGSDRMNVGTYGTALGSGTKAPGAVALACGSSTEANGDCSFASGSASYADGKNSRASGRGSHAKGDYSVAEGDNVRAYSANQHVQGKWNKEDSAGKYAHIVGNGADGNSRSNAYTLDWNGNAWFKGGVYVGSDEQSKGDKLVTKKELDAAVANAGGSGGTGVAGFGKIYLTLPEEYDGQTQVALVAYADKDRSIQLSYEEGKAIIENGCLVTVSMAGQDANFLPLIAMCDDNERMGMVVLFMPDDTFMAMLLFSDSNGD